MQKNKVAVIVPCWNCEQYIGDFLESMIQQTYKEWDLYIVDDQSTDSSLEITKKYSEKDSRIHSCVRDSISKGAQTCRNIGFHLAKDVKYVIWFDCDDLIAPYCLQQRVEYMEKHPELDFGIFPAKTFKNDIYEKEGQKVYGFPLYYDTLLAMFQWTLPMVGWTNIYRRKCLIKKGLKWDERIKSMQDSDFNISCLLKGLRYDYAVKEGAKIDYFYRSNHVNTITTSAKLFSLEHFESHLYYLNKVTSSLSTYQSKKYRKVLKCYIIMFLKILCNDKDSFRNMLQIPWIKSNLAFYLKLKMVYLVNLRGFRWLFKKQLDSIDEMQSEWNERMKRALYMQ